MTELVLAFDLGTGSCKASLWKPDGECIAETSTTYPTAYAGIFQEQRPDDWWHALSTSARRIMRSLDGRDGRVVALAVSGHSLGMVGIDARGLLVRETTPLWSDARGDAAARRAFDTLDELDWYRSTGNGFPPGLYPAFKLGWYAEHDPAFLRSTSTLLGSKDWINFRLTGERVTDPSYASGSGLWELRSRSYSTRIAAAAGVDVDLLPPVVPTATVVGTVLPAMADELGIPAGIPVATGGVDNSCMSAGSLNTTAGRVFLSLGSSSWVVATVEEPVLDEATRPYTFCSLLPGLFDSALSSFSAGTALQWVRTLLGGGELLPDEEFVALAMSAEPGARGLTFLPMVSGGAPIEGGSLARGAFLGIDSSHGRPEIARAALEGTVFSLARAFGALTATTDTSEDPIVATGGGSRHAAIRQLYADVLGRPVARSSVDQQAAALGAAATGFVALGLWPSMQELHRAHQILARHEPDSEAFRRYPALLERFEEALAVAPSSAQPPL